MILVGLAITIVVGRIAYVEQDNLSSFLMQIHHEYPCPMHAIIPNTVSLVGFY